MFDTTITKLRQPVKKEDDDPNEFDKFLKSYDKLHESTNEFLQSVNQFIKKLHDHEKEIEEGCTKLNKKRVIQYTSLLQIALCLFDKPTIDNKLLTKINVPIDQDKLTQLKQDLSNRNKILDALTALLAQMQADLASENEEVKDQYVQSDECFLLIDAFQDLIVQDFNITKNLDIIRILAQYHLSPWPKDFLQTYHLKETNEDMEYKNSHLSGLIKAQRLIRSAERKKFHLELFGKKPTPFNATFLKDLFPETRDQQRILKIIYELSASLTIISPEITHWTTKDNFKKIIASHYMYGNKTLQEQGVFFRKNALVKSDVANGDYDIICFCPFLVDPIAWFNSEMRLKSNLMNFKIDLNAIDSFGKYNQFFKIFDLCSPSFSYKVTINERLKIKIRKQPGSFVIRLILDGEIINLTLYETNRSKSDILHYGNIYTINRFCLATLFNLLSENRSQPGVGKFINYLISSSDSEIKKILIILGQSMTLFAEYNFNSMLKLNDNLITSIHDVKQGVTYDLKGVSKQDYAQNLRHFIENKPVDIPQINERILWEDTNNSNTFYYGNNIKLETRAPKIDPVDLSGVPPQLFNTEKYIETRPAPNHNRLTPFNEIQEALRP